MYILSTIFFIFIALVLLIFIKLDIIDLCGIKAYIRNSDSPPFYSDNVKEEFSYDNTLPLFIENSDNSSPVFNANDLVNNRVFNPKPDEANLRW